MPARLPYLAATFVLSGIGLGAVLASKRRRSTRASGERAKSTVGVTVARPNEARQNNANDEPPRPAADPADFTKFVRDAAIPLIALFAAGGYAIIRPAFDGFYSALGLQPEDVGINEAQMLSMGSLIGLLYGVALVLSVWLLFWYWQHPRLRGLKPHWRFLIGIGLALSGWTLAKIHMPFIHLQSDLLPGRIAHFLRLAIIVVLVIGGTGSALNAAVRLLATRRQKPGLRREPGKKSVVPAGLALALIAIFIAAGVGRLQGSSAGQDLLTRPDSFSTDHPIISMILAESITPIFVIPITGDKLGICARTKAGYRVDIYLLGRNSNGAFILASRTNNEEFDNRVVFLPSADYELFSGGLFVGPGFGGCHSPGLYNDPPFLSPRRFHEAPIRTSPFILPADGTISDGAYVLTVGRPGWRA